MDLVQSTAFNRPIFMVGTADHITGLAGLTLTITASKDGAAFASISPTVTDLGNGWYSLALTTTHTNTLGALAFHITGAAADPTDFADLVVSTGSAPTAAQVATAIWTDLLASADFSTAASIGAKLKALQIGIQKNTAFANFQFRMVDDAGDPVTGLVNADFTTKTFSIAGGAQGTITGAVTEDPGLDGFYLVSLLAAELNGNSVSLVFDTATTIQTALTIWPSS